MIRRTGIGLALCAALSSCAVETVVEPAPIPVPAAAATGTNPERFAQAYHLWRGGQYESAAAAFEQLETAYPQLADYHLFYFGSAQARRGEHDEARAALTRLLAEFPESVHADDASLELGRLLLEQGDDHSAMTFIERAASSGNAAVRNGAALATAEVNERRGDVRGAHEQLMSVRRNARGTAAAREAKRSILELRQRYQALVPTGVALYDEVKLLLDERDYSAAAAAMERLRSAPPPAIDAAELTRLEAETLLGRGRLEDGLAALWRVADDHPRSPAAPAALFRLASLLWNRDRDAAALRAFEELRTRYPGDAKLPDAIYAAARIHNAAGREEEAIETYDEVVRRFPRHDLAAESKWRIGWIHYRAGRWEDATVAFADLADSTSGKRHDEAMYWRARTHDNAGRTARAREIYRELAVNGDESPYSAYYAAWSQTRLSSGATSGVPFGLEDAESVKPPHPREPVPPPGLPPFHAARWRELRLSGIDELTRAELAAIEASHGSDPAVASFLVDAYQAADDYRRARALVERGTAASLSSRERKELLYPLAFWNDVREESLEKRIDPIWVVALVRQESMFDPDARSPADARGLMQLLPSTAKRVAGRGDQNELDLSQPRLNIELGTTYLRSLIDRFDGDVLKALAAYNGGEAAVDRWQQQFGSLAPDEFVESITYRETRDYVKRVAGNYRVYREIYAR
jgi:soluble lytic murein transglycosylase